MFQGQRKQSSWVRFANFIKLNTKLAEFIVYFFHVADPKCVSTQNYTVELFLPPVLSKMQIHSSIVLVTAVKFPCLLRTQPGTAPTPLIFLVWERIWSEFLQPAQMAINMIKMSIRKPQWEMRIPHLFFPPYCKITPSRAFKAIFLSHTRFVLIANLAFIPWQPE